MTGLGFLEIRQAGRTGRLREGTVVGEKGCYVIVIFNDWGSESFGPSNSPPVIMVTTSVVRFWSFKFTTKYLPY